MNKDWSKKSYPEMLVVEGFTIKDLPGITMRSAQITGVLAPLIAISVVMQQILSLLGAQGFISEFLTGLGATLYCLPLWRLCLFQGWFSNHYL